MLLEQLNLLTKEQLNKFIENSNNSIKHFENLYTESTNEFIKEEIRKISLSIQQCQDELNSRT